MSVGRSFLTAFHIGLPAGRDLTIPEPKSDNSNSRPTAAQLFEKHGVGPASGHHVAHELNARGLGTGQHAAQKLRGVGMVPGQLAAQDLFNSTKSRGATGGCSKQHDSRPGSGSQGTATGNKSNSMRKALGLRTPPPSVRQGAGPKAFGMVSKKPTALKQPVLQDPTKHRKPAGAAFPANAKGMPGAKRPRRQQSMEECLAGVSCPSEGEAEEAAAGCGKIFRDRGAGRDTAGNVGASPLLGSFYGAASQSS